MCVCVESPQTVQTYFPYHGVFYLTWVKFNFETCDLQNAMNNLKSESPSNISAALSTAFEILHKYNRSSLGSQCNQAIMLITAKSESVPNDLIKRYNSPHMPVRLFAYVVGGDKSEELHAASCSNKGLFTVLIVVIITSFDW